jgi:glycosyltransferase involved in cell wall biosynthesis
MVNIIKQRSIRILFDLQATQSPESRSRGVGRYSRDLFEAFAKIAPPREMFALYNSQAPYTSSEYLTATKILELPKLPKWHTARDFNGGNSDSLDALALSAFINEVKPDIIHLSHIFEGYNFRVPLPHFQCKSKGQIFSATLYDLIPLRFQDHYLKNSDYRKWYLSRLQYLSQMDLLFAISEATRQDAISLLNFDPDRIITIPGGISSVFKPIDRPDEELRRLKQKFKIKNKFLLYTGGDDFRKNLKRAIQSFALLPLELRKDYQLIIACAMEESRKQGYLSYAHELKLATNELIITGFVSERDLVALYSTCELFIFPSLYEGFGLPVLEAMSCGAPVIGANNSSIKELIDLPEALFDAQSTSSITDKIVAVLSNPDFKAHLKSYGQQRVKTIHWQTSAEILANAFDTALITNQATGVKATIHGWLPRKKMAYFTPLPPCQSGIADYNAKFLPLLAKYFEIDIYVDGYQVNDLALTSTFRIYDANDFEQVANAYDVIFYEMGNSEFHVHMVDLCLKYPGIIGLHDAYLSGLVGYLEFNLGRENQYSQEMLYSHSTLARNYLIPAKYNHYSNGEAMVNLPCTKRILDSAIGLISHSAFNLEITRQFYPEGYCAPYKIIPQMVKINEPTIELSKNILKKQHKFKDTDFIVCTFGHVTWNKCGDFLLEAYSQSSLLNANTILVFVGELAKDDFGKKIINKINEYGLQDKVRITGFLDEQQYNEYLHIADLAIQLRINSRGGTPKGVLDCLSNKVPVIVNNDASYKDYPDDVVFKMSTVPTIENICNALTNLYANREYRQKIATKGHDYLKAVHNPETSAAYYATAIHEFCDRHHLANKNSYVSLMAPHLVHCQNINTAIEHATNWLHQPPKKIFRKSRLFIDVSHISNHDHETGIQRVVKEIIKAAYCYDIPAIDPIAFQLKDGKPKIARQWLSKSGLLMNHELNAGDVFPELLPGDIILMLDSSWDTYSDFYPFFEQARQLKIPVYTAIYDILPITLPPGNFVEGGKEWFANWFEKAISSSDGLICISKATADEVITWLDQRDPLSKKPKIGYWHLGSDFIASHQTDSTAQQVPNKPYLLMVGTIEPRKCHLLAITAMEKLWENKPDLCLCIAGKEGWLVTETMVKIRNHPLLNKKLFFIEKPNDSELMELYKNATGLLFLSKGEGFGLPIIEAAHYNLPIICSNIPVLKEIATTFATYVEIRDSETLASDLEKWYTSYQQGEITATSKMPRLTWKESINVLYNVFLNNNWYRSDL